MDLSYTGFSCLLQENPAVHANGLQASLAAMESIHQRIKRLRLKKELTLDDFADKVGLSRQAVAQWEFTDPKKKPTAPSRKLQPKVAEVLGISVQELLTGAPEGGDPLLAQLIAIYGQLSEDGRDTLLGRANRILAKEHPQDRAIDPFPGQEPPKEPVAADEAKKARVRT